MLLHRSSCSRPSARHGADGRNRGYAASSKARVLSCARACQGPGDVPHRPRLDARRRRRVLKHGSLHLRDVVVARIPHGQCRKRPWGTSRWWPCLDGSWPAGYPGSQEYVRAVGAIGNRHGPALEDWIGHLPIEAVGTRTAEYAIDCMWRKSVEEPGMGCIKTGMEPCGRQRSIYSLADSDFRRSFPWLGQRAD